MTPEERIRLGRATGLWLPKTNSVKNPKPQNQHEDHISYIKEIKDKNGRSVFNLYCMQCEECADKPIWIKRIAKSEIGYLKYHGVEFRGLPKRPEAIVYRWTDHKLGKKYIGSHVLNPGEPYEGLTKLEKHGTWKKGEHGLFNIWQPHFNPKFKKPDTHNGYVCSSKSMLDQMKLRPTDFSREVLATGSTYKMRKFETKLLQEINAAGDETYYNKHNNNKIENCLTYHKSFVCQELNQHFSLRCVCDFQKLSDITLEEAYILEQEGYPSIPEDQWSKLEEEVKRLKKQNKLHKSWNE